jgi:hypothetical protein
MIGGVQLLLSQMQNLQAACMTSAVGGLAAIVYCVVTLVLAASQVNDAGTKFAAPVQHQLVF